MKFSLNLLGSDIKNFFDDSINRVFVSVLALCVCIVVGQYRTETMLKQISSDIKINRDKIHYRYFNLNNTLQDLFKVEIETHHGRVVKR